MDFLRRHQLKLVVLFAIAMVALLVMARGQSKLNEKCFSHLAGSCQDGLTCLPNDPSCYGSHCGGTCVTVCSTDTDCTAPLQCGSFQSVREHVCRR